MATATNPETGERVYLDEATGQWLPAKTATNPKTGEKVFHDGTGWQPLPPPKAAAPPLETFQPNTFATQPSVIGPAARTAQWPAGGGDPVAGIPGFDVPMVGDDQVPPARAFPDPAGSFPDPDMQAGRAGKIALQAAGSGAVNVPGMLFDIPALAAKGIEHGAYKAADTVAGVGAKILGLGDFSTPRIVRPEGMPNRQLPTDFVKGIASDLAEKAGYEAVEPNSLKEKTLSNVVQLGTEGLGSGLALSKAAGARALELAKPGAMPLRSDKFVRPYFDAPVKTVIGDTAAGATGGAALTGAQQIPEDVRARGGGSVGVLSDIFAQLVGGVSGGTLASGVMGAPTTTGNLITRNKMADGISVDPTTGMYVSNQTADEATKFLRSLTTSDPEALSAQIGQRTKEFRDAGLPVPTTGLLTDDIGLAGLEKRQRTRAGPGPTELDPNASAETKQTYSFGARDQALRDSASENVQSIRQPGVDPELFQKRAQERAAMELEARQRQVDQPAGRARGVEQALETEANQLSANVGQTPGASSNILDTYRNTRVLERERKDALYANPAWTESHVDINPTLEAAQEIHSKATGSSPVSPLVEPFLKRIEAAKDAGTLPGWEVSKMIKDIEAKIKVSLKDGEDFKPLKELKDSLVRSIDQLPDDHPGKIAIEAARTNVRERIAPNFRENVGGSLDMRLKTNPGQVQPETAGAEFLNRGSSARQLMDIANLRGNADEVAANARSIIMDRLAQGGVIKDGAIDPDKLVQWRNKNVDVINSIPELRGQVDTLVADARSGVDLTARVGGKVKQAETKLAETTKELQQGPVGKIADRTPDEAVGRIMDGPNAPKNMAELRRKMGNNPDADASLKAAVTDHFVKEVGALNPAHGDYEVKLSALVKKFEKHRDTLIAAGMKPDEMQALQRAQTVLSPLLKRNVQATVGSTTAESTEAAMRPLELALKGYYGILKGGGMFRTLKVAIKTMTGDSNIPVERLITRAMFDPELAQTLLTRNVKEAGTPKWNAQLQKVLRRVTAARGAVQEDDEDEPAGR